MVAKGVKGPPVTHDMVHLDVLIRLCTVMADDDVNKDWTHKEKDKDYPPRPLSYGALCL
jgi:hypothetical protein